MNFEETAMPGLLKVRSAVQHDERGDDGVDPAAFLLVAPRGFDQDVVEHRRHLRVQS